MGEPGRPDGRVAEEGEVSGTGGRAGKTIMGGTTALGAHNFGGTRSSHWKNAGTSNVKQRPS